MLLYILSYLFGKVNILIRQKRIIVDDYVEIVNYLVRLLACSTQVAQRQLPGS